MDTQHLCIEEYDILRNLPGGDKGIIFKKRGPKLEMLIDILGFEIWKKYLIENLFPTDTVVFMLDMKFYLNEFFLFSYQIVGLSGFIFLFRY